MSGFGDSVFGLTPFGTGTPTAWTAPPDVAHGARYIDPRTKDWVVADDGEWQRMPAVRQAVLIALATVFGSSSVEQRWGVRLPRKIGTSYETDARTAITQALRFLTSAGKLRLLGIDIEKRSTSRVRHTVRYFDLTLDREDSVTVNR